MIILNPAISVIIPTLNEEPYVQQCLSSLKNQECTCNFEIIVVDSGSSDNTLRIAKQYANHIIISPERNPGVQRNLGAKKAKGKIVAFIDADTVASRYWLANIVKTFQDKKVVAVIGPLLPLEKIRRFYIFKFTNTLQRILIKINYPLFWGASCAFRTNAFWKVEGFDQTLLTSEDHDISLKIKKIGKVVFDNNMLAFTSYRRFLKNERKAFFFYMKDVIEYFILRPVRTYLI